MNEFESIDEESPDRYSPSRRSVLKAVGVTAVAGGVIPGAVAAQSQSQRVWRPGDNGSENNEEGCTNLQFVLTPGGGRVQQLQVSSITADGNPIDPATGRYAGNGVYQFSVPNQIQDEVVVTYSGGGDNVRLVLSEADCEDDEIFYVERSSPSISWISVCGDGCNATPVCATFDGTDLVRVGFSGVSEDCAIYSKAGAGEGGIVAETGDSLEGVGNSTFCGDPDPGNQNGVKYETDPGDFDGLPSCPE
jgi:hypothetical protein